MSTTTTPSQSTQYNQIADAYSFLYPPEGPPNIPSGPLEIAQLQVALTSSKISLRDKRVLDLACGNGFYSTRYLAWGAQSVTGIDISQGMLEVARSVAVKRGIPESKLKYLVGDVTAEDLLVDGAPFDLVTSSWLLNYASNSATMTQMWRTIARHLKPGGWFVGLTIPPLHRSSKEGLAEEANILTAFFSPDGAWGKDGNRGRVLGFVEEGLKIELELGYKEKGENVAVFENYYLSREAFDKAIRNCIIDGEQAFDGLEWRDFVVPDELKESKPAGYWNDATLSPIGRVCVARRRGG